MILELDLGNTRGKWRLLDGDAVRSRGSLSIAELKSGNLPESWAGMRLQRVRAANVAGAAVADALAAVVSARFALPVEFARVTSQCAGVTCGYRHIERLGVDRWLAVLAAHHKDPRAALIVDCGSAVTLDLLDNGGRHLGGYIVPGLDLMRRALFQDTDAVKVSSELAPNMSLAPGRDTADAVNRGLVVMALGAIDRAMAELHSAGAASPRLWLTGGDGPLLSALCDRPHQLVTELVLDGLALTNP
ncbi:pantothenate kinase [Microbulbifer donghaiensis]|uniref:Type III pantothenate kinase n=1 Tax=Microbulbifer donghaiensis TaxID=494016 RepID=A0A1M5HNU3_9GAMM|nr:type III pantothenate kinase [Microbulbifer donghaiensis]SHG17610.1 pantothenate kinase [Microbulbifer donghaiensis]